MASGSSNTLRRDASGIDVPVGILKIRMEQYVSTAVRSQRRLQRFRVVAPAPAPLRRASSSAVRHHLARASVEDGPTRLPPPAPDLLGFSHNPRESPGPHKRLCFSGRTTACTIVMRQVFHLWLRFRRDAATRGTPFSRAVRIARPIFQTRPPLRAKHRVHSRSCSSSMG